MLRKFKFYVFHLLILSSANSEKSLKTTGDNTSFVVVRSRLPLNFSGNCMPPKRVEVMGSRLEVRSREKEKFPFTLKNRPHVGVEANVKVETPSWFLHLPEGAVGLAQALQKDHQLNRNWDCQFWEAVGFRAVASRPQVYNFRSTCIQAVSDTEQTGVNPWHKSSGTERVTSSGPRVQAFQTDGLGTTTGKRWKRLYYLDIPSLVPNNFVFETKKQVLPLPI